MGEGGQLFLTVKFQFRDVERKKATERDYYQDGTTVIDGEAAIDATINRQMWSV